jgi:hypothetical protein
MSEFADLADTEASPEPVLEPIEMPRPVEPPRASVSAGWGEDDIT